jgi:hypothetical protein
MTEPGNSLAFVLCRAVYVAMAGEPYRIQLSTAKIGIEIISHRKGGRYTGNVDFIAQGVLVHAWFMMPPHGAQIIPYDEPNLVERVKDATRRMVAAEADMPD